MKRICFLALASLALLSACSKKEYEYHQTNFLPVGGDAGILYADQESDTTLKLLSYDSWTLQAESEGNWFSVSPTHLTVPFDNVGLIQRLDITATPNTTGKVREGRIKVDSFMSIGRQIHQFYWLHIIVPEAILHDNTMTRTDSVRFDLEVPAEAHNTALKFRTYKEGATLTSIASWITMEDSVFLLSGLHEPTLQIAANPENEERRDTLHLTSNGVTSLICIKQKGKK